jgi:hypothetical protein
LSVIGLCRNSILRMIRISYSQFECPEFHSFRHFPLRILHNFVHLHFHCPGSIFKGICTSTYLFVKVWVFPLGYVLEFHRFWHSILWTSADSIHIMCPFKGVTYRSSWGGEVSSWLNVMIWAWRMSTLNQGRLTAPASPFQPAASRLNIKSYRNLYSQHDEVHQVLLHLKSRGFVEPEEFSV